MDGWVKAVPGMFAGGCRRGLQGAGTGGGNEELWTAWAGCLAPPLCL